MAKIGSYFLFRSFRNHRRAIVYERLHASRSPIRKNLAVPADLAPANPTFEITVIFRRFGPWEVGRRILKFLHSTLWWAPKLGSFWIALGRIWFRSDRVHNLGCFSKPDIRRLVLAQLRKFFQTPVKLAISVKILNNSLYFGLLRVSIEIFLRSARSWVQIRYTDHA